MAHPPVNTTKHPAKARARWGGRPRPRWSLPGSASSGRPVSRSRPRRALQHAVDGHVPPLPRTGASIPPDRPRGGGAVAGRVGPGAAAGHREDHGAVAFPEHGPTQPRWTPRAEARRHGVTAVTRNPGTADERDHGTPAHSCGHELPVRAGHEPGQGGTRRTRTQDVLHRESDRPAARSSAHLTSHPNAHSPEPITTPGGLDRGILPKRPVSGPLGSEGHQLPGAVRAETDPQQPPPVGAAHSRSWKARRATGRKTNGALVPARLEFRQGHRYGRVRPERERLRRVHRSPARCRRTSPADVESARTVRADIPRPSAVRLPASDPGAGSGAGRSTNHARIVAEFVRNGTRIVSSDHRATDRRSGRSPRHRRRPFRSAPRKTRSPRAGSSSTAIVPVPSRGGSVGRPGKTVTTPPLAHVPGHQPQ
jgi:hypothetical protein